MELEKKNKLTCEFCKMELSSVYCKNRHVRTKHPEEDSGSISEQPKRTRHIICPICTTKTSFTLYNALIKHLTSFHNLTIKESVLNFRNFEELKVWRALENREVGYACRTKVKYPNGKEQHIYDCNRSDSRGFVSTAKARRPKSRGSIRIHGTCPSRIVANVSANGSVTVNFTGTHVGHSDEVRTKRPSKAKQSIIVVSKDSGKIQNDLDDQDDVTHFFNDTRPHTKPTTFEEKREVISQEICSYIRTLDEESLNKFIVHFKKFKSDIEQQNVEKNFKKIKMEKQTVADQSRGMWDQTSGAAIAQDPKVAIKTEWEALEIVDHHYALQDIRSKLIDAEKVKL